MKDAVALITGGAGHIGEATCRKLASRGTHPIIIDKNAERGTALVNELNDEFGVRGAFYDVDIGDSSSFEEIRAVVASQFGRLDFVVNNAAFYDDMPGWDVPFDQEGYDAWTKVMQVNLLAPFFLVQALTPMLRQSALASVVNISSIYGVVAPDHGLYEGLGMTNPAAYAASKAGLLQTTRWLSAVLAPDIRVNAVSPGGVARGQDETFVARYRARTPLDRMATESDISSSIVFLLSPDASYITGQNLTVDGGWTVW